MADIFREIEEELRQERAERLWKKYGRYVIAGAVALVVAVGAWRAWQEYRQSQAEALGERYAAAVSLLGEGKTEDAAALFANIGKDGSTGFGILARLELAAIRTDQGDLDGAIRLYDEIAADSGVKPAFRDLASIRAAEHLLNKTPVDYDAVLKRVTPLARAGAAFRHSANEIIGLVAMQRGDDKAAREAFQKIVDDPESPPGLRTRATQMLTVIGS